jgi:taurine dioxygenase
MSSLNIRPLQDDLPFGARIGGVTLAALEDEAVRAEINAVFEAKGMIVFEDVEPSARMHVALSDVFGPMKDHPSPAVARVDSDGMPGVIDMPCAADMPGVIKVNGTRLQGWLPWHFDHAYNNELNRAGVLRAITIPPEGGLTGFVDGVQMYDALSPELRDQIEGRNILYKMNVFMGDMRFGQPESYEPESERIGALEVMDAAKTTPRALHPAVWTRANGEKVLHISPWMAEGIEGQEDAGGEALLEAISQEIYARATPYWHGWKHTDMLIWDNWRMLHGVSGHPPQYARHMQRTTIKGDYGLGRFEGDGKGSKVLEMTF